MFLDHSVTYIFEICKMLWDMVFRQISFKCVGTDATKPFNFNKCRSPRPLFNVVCHCSSSLMSIGIRIEKTTLIGEGGGGGVRYYV